MNLKTISDDMLLGKTKELACEERRITTEVLYHLREVERRRLYSSLGYSSLFCYCVQELKYSDSSAQRRISSMRLLREFPEIESQIQSGELSLTVISQAQTFFKNENMNPQEKAAVLNHLKDKSSRDAEKILVSMATKPIISQERVRTVSANQVEVKFVASEELMEDLEKLKGLLAHQHPNASISELIPIAVKMALKKLDPAERSQKALPAPAVKRYVARALKTYIWKRDQGKCTYVGPKTGRRCNSNYALQSDHRQPFALGGPTSAENLRLLCRSHNLFESRKLFGDWTEKFRNVD